MNDTKKTWLSHSPVQNRCDWVQPCTAETFCQWGKHHYCNAMQVFIYYQAMWYLIIHAPLIATCSFFTFKYAYCTGYLVIWSIKRIIIKYCRHHRWKESQSFRYQKNHNALHTLTWEAGSTPLCLYGQTWRGGCMFDHFGHCGQQLDSAHLHTKILFVDFSSASNINILMHQLVELQVHPALIFWINSFLQDRPQEVLVNSFKSNCS